MRDSNHRRANQALALGMISNKVAGPSAAKLGVDGGAMMSFVPEFYRAECFINKVQQPILERQLSLFLYASLPESSTIPTVTLLSKPQSSRDATPSHATNFIPTADLSS